MKKKNIKSLKLNKKSISNVQSNATGGGFSFFCTTSLMTIFCDIIKTGHSDEGACMSFVNGDCPMV
jgi:hypothetical protein